MLTRSQQHVDLTDLPVDTLRTVLRYILPLKKNLVISLVWDHNNLVEGLAKGTGASRSLADLIKLFNGLRHIRTNVYQTGATAAHRRRAFSTTVKSVFSTLTEVAPQLRSVSLNFDDAHSVDGQRIIAFLSACRDLTHLELSPSSSPDGITLPFLTSFSHLTHLTSLEVWFPLPSTVLSIPTPWPLTRLLLDCSGPRNPAAFVSVLSRFSTTLRRFEAYNVPRESFYEAYPLSSSGKAPLQLPLPKVEELVVGQPYDHSIFPYLASSPVRYLEIKWLSEETMPELEAFLEEKKAVLKTVKVWVTTRDERDERTKQWRRVRGWCEERGIAFGEIEDIEEEEAERE
jgi:hypothetical protein